MALERLQKILAHAGIASRRKAEQLILAGRVSVNGQVVTELGSKADPERDEIKVDGRRVRLPVERLYLAVYKPRGMVSTLFDPQGRPHLADLLKRLPARVYPVGRMDYASEGLLIATNDGEFAQSLLAASKRIPKTYLVKVNGMLSGEQLRQFREGVPLAGRRTPPAEIRLLERAANPWYRVTLTETRRDQLRLMFKHFGRLVEKLRRIQIGPVELGKLRPGEFRPLKPGELAALRKLLEQPGRSAAGERRASSRTHSHGKHR
ncbi:MAG: pseudouridine synthase [Bryobacterales bacterium]|nr:rRNA pseudouridine synthase [Bryobacteraceae bacterium]MDW8130327.1 pseudouridine synthase [Bryobacterales bacterium]